VEVPEQTKVALDFLEDQVAAVVAKAAQHTTAVLELLVKAIQVVEAQTTLLTMVVAVAEQEVLGNPLQQQVALVAQVFCTLFLEHQLTTQVAGVATVTDPLAAP
jgi:Trp operon repressor